MKTIVINEREGTRIPFLRGILTRSLLDSGLPFEEAFEMATRVREDFADSQEIPSAKIRSAICGLLKEAGQREVLESYRVQVVAPARIVVRNPSGASSAFSRGKHELYLQAAGIKPDRAESTTNRIFEVLLAAGVDSITTRQLGYLTYLCLEQEVSKKAAKRYLLWSEYQRSARPLAVLICGTMGSGKSTIASEVAHVLDIVRIQSTDMLREVMRMMIPKRLLPVLHKSSFTAWKTLPAKNAADRDWEQLVVDGYRSQADLLAVPCVAVLHRAVEEGVPLILEGVHTHPDLMQRMPEDTGVILVHVTLAVLKTKELRARLRGRGAEVPQRRSKRYLKNFDSIWSLQSYLLSEADRCNVPIITNHDREKAVWQIVQQVSFELARHFDGTPEDIFGPVVERCREQATELPWHDMVPHLIE